jgi:cupin fold WbuC family metalloprotein|tara:strand:- start:1908 stop:2453 length:546 start_codon:yes stop_codon:yes gene_type:complete
MNNKIMNTKQVSNDVFYIDDPFVNINCNQIEKLKNLVGNSSLKRNRLCVHRTIEDKIHEMFIVLLKDTYIMPAKHIGKIESLLVLEGCADAVFFNEEGKISNVVPLGEYSSGLQFYYRMDDPIYHTLIIKTKYFIFKEVTQGPLNKRDTIIASWAPQESNKTDAAEYMEKLKHEVATMLTI